MAARKIAIFTLVICFCFGWAPFHVGAASTSDASEPICVEQDCHLTLSYTCEQTAFADVSVRLYKIAEVSADFQYTLTDSFTSSALVLNGIRSVGEWNTIRCTLEALIVADNLLADAVAQTDGDGKACFEALKPGLYLAVVGAVTQDDLHCYFDSALVALPGLSTDGNWQYQVSVASKFEIVPPGEVDDEIPFKIIKLWKGDEGRNVRPDSVEVEIFRDGESYTKAMLCQENNWSYSWSAKKDGAQWTVIERNTPTGYTMTVEKRENAFVLTNTFGSGNPDEPFEPPQTGDTSNIMFYVILMVVSGSMLLLLGCVGKKDTHEKSR